MKRIKKAVAVTGKYTGSDGKEKNQYVNCGSLFQREDGSFTMKLDALPLGDFNGWINFYDLDQDREKNNQSGMAQAKQELAPDPLDDMDVPF